MDRVRVLICWRPIQPNSKVCFWKTKKAIADVFYIIVNDTTLNLTADMTVLGITIDSHLNFNVHVSNMCNKAGRQLNVLQRLKGYLEYSSRLSIYKSFIMSNFNYCPMVLMFTSKSSLSKLEDIQKRALMFVLDDYTSLLGFVRTRVLMSRSRLNNGATHGGWHFDIHRDFDTRGR